jgi:hypothetical protein
MPEPEINPYAAPQTTQFQIDPKPSLPVAFEVHPRHMFPEMSTVELRRVVDACSAIRFMNGIYYMAAFLIYIVIAFIIICGIVAFFRRDTHWDLTIMLWCAGTVLVGGIFIGLIFVLMQWSDRSRWVGMILDGLVITFLFLLSLLCLTILWPMFFIMLLIGSIPYAALRARKNCTAMYGTDRVLWEHLVEELTYREEHNVS